jgi:hypothetical protein
MYKVVDGSSVASLLACEKCYLVFELPCVYLNRKLWNKRCREKHRLLVSEIIKKGKNAPQLLFHVVSYRSPPPSPERSCRQANVMLCTVEKSQNNKPLLNSVIADKFDSFSFFAMLWSTRFRFCVRTFACYVILKRTLYAVTRPHRLSSQITICFACAADITSIDWNKSIWP